jgi:hypothetical protein
MAEGCISESWNHTSAVLALLANVHRDPRKGRAMRPADFHPMHKTPARKPAVLKGSVELLKTVFVDNLCGKPVANSP